MWELWKQQFDDDWFPIKQGTDDCGMLIELGRQLPAWALESSEQFIFDGKVWQAEIDVEGI